MTTIELTFHEVAGATTGPALAAVVTLSRPEQLNPIDTEMLTDLDAALDDIEARREVRTILVTGAGRAVQCRRRHVGLPDAPAEPGRVPAFRRRRPPRLLPAAQRTPSRDCAGQRSRSGRRARVDPQLRLRDRGARSARIGDGHLNFGQMGGGGVLTLLHRAVGKARATELMLTGRLLSADEAASWGLVSRVVDDDALLAAGLELAGDIAAKSPLGVANAKQVMHRIWAENATVDDGLAAELAADVEYCLTSYDAPEGLAAFAEKRPPRFEGR